MKILIIGGTQFVGRHITAQALAQGHDVTLFNRGTTNRELFSDASRISGDRNKIEDLAQLGDAGPFDATIDCCAYFPRQFIALRDALGGRGGHYTLISSVSVYGNDAVKPGVNEDDPTSEPLTDDQDLTDIDMETYGPLKVALEILACGARDEATVVRPGLVIGPDDPTGRFTYWPVRMAQGGRVLAPGNPQRLVQAIDVRDLAAFTVLLTERKLGGRFNAVCPTLPFADFLQQIGLGSGFDGELVWQADQALLDAGATPMADLPFWMPNGASGLLQVSGEKAAAAGLQCRAISDSARDTLAWVRDGGEYAQAGMTGQREAELLDAGG